MPNQRVPDVTVRPKVQFPDHEVKTTHDDWYAQVWETEFGRVLIENSTGTKSKEASITEVSGETYIQRKLRQLKQLQSKIGRG